MQFSFIRIHPKRLVRLSFPLFKLPLLFSICIIHPSLHSSFVRSTWSFLFVCIAIVLSFSHFPSFFHSSPRKPHLISSFSFSFSPVYRSPYSSPNHPTCKSMYKRILLPTNVMNTLYFSPLSLRILRRSNINTLSALLLADTLNLFFSFICNK